MTKLTCKEFTDLQDEWDQRLANSGFVDIEKKAKSLRQPSDGVFRWSENMLKREAKCEYFSLLTQFVSSEFIKDPSERVIMQMASEGKTRVEISIQLKLLGLRKHDLHTILYVCRRHENKWGIRKWNREQMVSRKVKKPPTP